MRVATVFPRLAHLGQPYNLTDLKSSEALGLDRYQFNCLASRAV